MYATGLMDPGGDMIRRLVVPTMATAFLSSLKYAYCGQMRKLTWMLNKRYAEAKELGTPNPERICVTCSAPITGRKLGAAARAGSALGMSAVGAKSRRSSASRRWTSSWSVARSPFAPCAWTKRSG